MGNGPDIMPKDIRVAMSFKNNLILSRMEEKGFKTIAELCRAVGINRTSLDELINMKEIPTVKKGAWRTVVLKLSDFFGCLPEDLFSEFQREQALEKNRTHAEMHFGEVHAMLASQNARLFDPITMAENAETRNAIKQALDGLPLQQRLVLMARFGIGQPEATLEEVAGRMGFTRERIRQIEGKALRMLRKRTRSNELLHEVYEFGE